jgi:tRNA(Ile)-lysidine synthase
MPSAGPDEPFLSRTTVRQAIGEACLANFYRTLERLGCWKQRFGVAVSGGPDSMALLLLCSAYEWPGSLFVATVDHGLRPESASEAQRVADLCDRLGVQHETIRITVPATRGGIQAAAREARYAALADWCPGRWLLTAHHRDDVAETLLMRLRRGSGVRGLARMAESAPLREGGPILLRPLLEWSKADLLGICARVGIETVADPSNGDPRYDRTAARTALARLPWLDPRQLFRAASNLAEADAALEWHADRCWTERAATGADGSLSIDARGLPHDTKRRLVERAMTLFAGRDPDRQVETLIAMLDAGEYAMLADVQVMPGPPWRFRRAPPRRSV